MSRNIWIGVIIVIVIGASAWWYLNGLSIPVISNTQTVPQQTTTQGGGSAGQQNPNTPVSTNNSIDQRTLVTSSGKPTISGTASESSAVYVYLFPATYTGGKDYASVSGAPQGDTESAYPSPAIVSNGRWSATFDDGRHSLGTGAYVVVVYDSSSHALLATGALTVK